MYHASGKEVTTTLHGKQDILQGIRQVPGAQFNPCFCQFSIRANEWLELQFQAFLKKIKN